MYLLKNSLFYIKVKINHIFEDSTVKLTENILSKVQNEKQKVNHITKSTFKIKIFKRHRPRQIAREKAHHEHELLACIHVEPRNVSEWLPVSTWLVPLLSATLGTTIPLLPTPSSKTRSKLSWYQVTDITHPALGSISKKGCRRPRRLSLDFFSYCVGKVTRMRNSMHAYTTILLFRRRFYNQRVVANFFLFFIMMRGTRGEVQPK